VEEMDGKQMRVALLCNLISPYRAPVYARLAEAFELGVFVGGAEGNRPEWQNVEVPVGKARVKRSWGLKIARRLRDRKHPGVYEDRTIHFTLGYFWDLIRYSPAAVISNEMGFRSMVALLYGTLWRRPVWIWWGGTLHTERNKGHARRWVRAVVSRWARRWISYGESSTEYLLSLGVARERIVQIQNCVDEKLFQPPVEPAVRLEPRPVLLHVGRLVGLKGVDRLLRAAAALQKEGKEFSLLLVGGGPEREALVTLAGELGLKHVHFMEPQRPERMPAVYRSADCLVFPTLEDVWGLVVNEALWCGVPVVCSIYAGCARELLPDECLFDPLDEKGFVEVLHRAIDGHVTEPDRRRLWTMQRVAETIEADVREHLRD
jgi:glycosyltransferase involved in cell wall biosynthesis